jgi:hypothetical protein
LKLAASEARLRTRMLIPGVKQKPKISNLNSDPRNSIAVSRTLWCELTSETLPPCLPALDAVLGPAWVSPAARQRFAIRVDVACMVAQRDRVPQKAIGMRKSMGPLPRKRFGGVPIFVD